MNKQRLTDILIEMNKAGYVELIKPDIMTMSKKHDYIRGLLIDFLINCRRSVVIICNNSNQADYYMNLIRQMVNTTPLKDQVTKRLARLIQFDDKKEGRFIKIMIDPDPRKLIGHGPSKLVVIDER